MTHVDSIWKAREDFTRQVDTSLKTKGKRKTSTTHSHPPSLCLTESVPLGAQHQQMSTGEEKACKSSAPPAWWQMAFPARSGRHKACLHRQTWREHNNLGTTPFKHTYMAPGLTPAPSAARRTLVLLGLAVVPGPAAPPGQPGSGRGPLSGNESQRCGEHWLPKPSPGSSAIPKSQLNEG